MEMERLTIGKLASAVGINLETVRYYERIGLMPEPGRSGGGHRHYDAVHVRRLKFIRRARELGFGLEDVRALLKLAEPSSMSCCESVEKIAAHHLKKVRAKLDDLVRMERILAAAVSQCGERLPECPVIEMLDAPLDRTHESSSASI
jgi:MerR family mercuric resistance operon transcriptional regulator